MAFDEFNRTLATWCWNLKLETRLTQSEKPYDSQSLWDNWLFLPYSQGTKQKRRTEQNRATQTPMVTYRSSHSLFSTSLTNTTLKGHRATVYSLGTKELSDIQQPRSPARIAKNGKCNSGNFMRSVVYSLRLRKSIKLKKEGGTH
jgi:hypothetical protein